MNGRERAAIRRLRAGVVPSWALERLSVAYEKIKKVVDQSLERVLAQKQIGPMFVEGEWGVGKTHLLSYVQASARTLGVPCALINLDAYASALNYPQRFYATIAERLALEEHHGLKAILTHLACDEQTRTLLYAFAESLESGDFSYALAALCHSALRGEEAVADEQYSWNVLLGLDVSWSVYGYKRRAALARISALSRMFGAIGLGGLVVLFDEAETIDQLWNIRSRLTAYTTIGTMCQSAGLWAIFGITERFNRTLAEDIKRLARDHIPVEENAHWFLTRWLKGAFDTVKPPSIDKHLAPMVAERVAELYRDAYEVDFDKLHFDQIVVEWVSNPVRNPRRLIRSIVERMDRARQIS